MSEYTKIVPAVAALDRTLEAGLGTPLESCLPGGAAAVATVTDELGQLVLEMALSPLSAEEEATFSGWTGEDVQAQALQGPLTSCPTVQAKAQAKPEEAEALRASLAEMVRAEEGARLFQLGAKSGARFAQGLLSFACLKLVDALEAGAGRPAEEQAAMLSETAKLRARVRALRERQDSAARRGEAKLQPLLEAAEAAEADARARGTMADLLDGGRPADHAVLEAAEMLTAAPVSTPASAPAQRRSKRR